MTDPTYPAYPIFAFLGFVAVFIPFPWHLEAWNSGTCYFMLWTGLACLNQFVNCVVWHANVVNHAPIWCDISTRIMISAAVGIPASSLSINRRLYNIARQRAVSITRAEKRRDVIIDSVICLLFPLLTLPLAYVVQGHRFNIFEDIGCFPVEYNTVATYFLVTMWPLVLGCVSLVYCTLSLRIFAKRRAEMSEFLSTNSFLTAGRYFRLMALAMTEMLCTTPLAIAVICINATTAPVQPWHSWSDTHFDFSRVDQIPSAIWRANHGVVIGMELSRWVLPVCAFLFFIFFGFASEARRHYLLAFQAIARRVGRPRGLKQITSSPFFGSSKPSMTLSVGSLPVYVTPKPPRFPSSPFDSVNSTLPAFDDLSDASTVFGSDSKSVGGRTSPPATPSLPSPPPRIARVS